MPELTVELSDLRGWSSQTGRASLDLEGCRHYAGLHIADADFGMILELMSGDYANMIPKMHGVLQADSTGLREMRDALDLAVGIYTEADRQSADQLAHLGGGVTGVIVDDGEAMGFMDPANVLATLLTPTGDGVRLPEVSFGFIWDKVCDLIVWVGFPDPREAVTRWLVGDIEKATRQVKAWQVLADAVDGVHENITSGKVQIYKTWTGDAAHAAITQMDRWAFCLGEQAPAMRKIGEHLRTVTDEAFKMAQVVVDIIKTVIDLITAALSNAAIPFYGQWKLIQSVKEAYQMVRNAIKVITVFHDLLTAFIDTIKMCSAYFSVEKLPASAGSVPHE